MFQEGRGFPHFIALGALLIAGACYPARAAVICVNPAGGSGCQTTIGAAVSAAAEGDTIQVAAGTYKETVHITVSLSLIGAGSATTIIDATGLPNGINVDGGAQGIGPVVVSGFTVENANFQGILVRSASGVTIWNNQVLNNNNSLDVMNLTCPGIPPEFERGEAFDCGEGIHLVGVDHSIVSNNVVQKNAGGILLSDDIGATHDNVIIGNLVSDNSYDCGVTLASHSGMGVFHNTIANNQSLRNGLKQPGAGAGVGIFAPGPGSQTYGNVVINNTLMGNGLPGVAMHNHAAPGVGGVPAGAPPVKFNNNVIIGNTISNNGADDADFPGAACCATPGSAGINIAGFVETDTVVTQNNISQQSNGVVVNVPGAVLLSQNNLSVTTGVNNVANGEVLASQNWWGCVGGPASVGCALATGNVLFSPPLTSPFTASQLPSAPGGGVTPPPPANPITIVVSGPGGATSSSNTFQTFANLVPLDVSQSTSTNPGALTYSWSSVPGYPSVGILAGTTATPTIQLNQRGTYQVQVTVTDSTGASASATVTLQYI